MPRQVPPGNVAMDKAQIIDAVLDLLKAEERDHFEFKKSLDTFTADLMAAREARLEAIHKTWKKAESVLTRSDYLEKYGLESNLLDAAVERGLITSVKPPHEGDGRYHYPDKAVPKKALQEMRAQLDEETFLVTRKALAFLGVSAQKLTAFKEAGKIAETVPDWNRDGLYSRTYYRLSELKALKASFADKPVSAKQQQRWEV